MFYLSCSLKKITMVFYLYQINIKTFKILSVLLRNVIKILSQIKYNICHKVRNKTKIRKNEGFQKKKRKFNIHMLFIRKLIITKY